MNYVSFVALLWMLLT